MPVGVFSLVREVFHYLTEPCLVLFLELLHDVTDSEASGIHVHLHFLDLFLEKANLFSEFATVGVKLLCFLLVLQDLPFVLVKLIFALINFRLQRV